MALSCVRLRHLSCRARTVLRGRAWQSSRCVAAQVVAHNGVGEARGIILEMCRNGVRFNEHIVLSKGGWSISTVNLDVCIFGYQKLQITLEQQVMAVENQLRGVVRRIFFVMYNEQCCTPSQ